MRSLPSLARARVSNMQKKVSPLCSFLPSFFISSSDVLGKSLPPDPSLFPLLSVGAWPAEIQPAARSLAFQLGLILLRSFVPCLMPHSLSFSLYRSSAECEACDEE